MSVTSDVPFVAPTMGQTTDPLDGLEPAEDLDPVGTAILEIFRTRGWVRTDKTGKIVPDDAKTKTFVYELFRDKGVVNSDSDIVDDGLSAADVYAKTFPSAVGVSSVPVDDVQFEAYRTVVRKLWQWASPGVKGYCQETAEMEGLDLVMVEKKVFRSSRDGSTGTGAPQSVPVRFFTSDSDLIFTLSSQPAAAKLVKAAEETAKHLQMNTARHPELTTRVAKETQSALKRSAAHLAPITASKSAGALTAGSDDL